MVSVNTILQAQAAFQLFYLCQLIFKAPGAVFEDLGVPPLGEYTVMMAHDFLALVLGCDFLFLIFVFAPAAVRSQLIRSVVVWSIIVCVGYSLSGLPVAKIALPVISLAFFAVAYYSTLGGAGFPTPRALPSGALKTCLTVIAGVTSLFALSGTVFVEHNIAGMGVPLDSPSVAGIKVVGFLSGVTMLAQATLAYELAFTVGDADAARTALYAWAVQYTMFGYAVSVSAPPVMTSMPNFQAQVGVTFVLAAYAWYSAAMGDSEPVPTAPSSGAGSRGRKAKA